MVCFLALMGSVGPIELLVLSAMFGVPVVVVVGVVTWLLKKQNKGEG